MARVRIRKEAVRGPGPFHPFRQVPEDYGQPQKQIYPDSESETRLLTVFPRERPPTLGPQGRSGLTGVKSCVGRVDLGLVSAEGLRDSVRSCPWGGQPLGLYFGF